MKSSLRKTLVWVFTLLTVFFLVLPKSQFAQEEEKKQPVRKNATVEKKHSPHKATLWSLIPGAGQIYNKKYWKVPIVYAGFAVVGYFIITNHSEYIKYNNAYICSAKADADTSYHCTDPIGSKYETSYIKSYRDYYRRNLELSYIIAGAWYILQMLDATVDAHLFYWEVNDNLSVKLDPIYEPVYLPKTQPAYTGLKVTLRF